MRLAGPPTRLELIPETPEDRAAINRILEKDVVIFWGDSEAVGGALILNNAPSDAVSKPARK